MTLIPVPLNAKYSMNEKEQRALDLMIESVLKPDSKLRGCAHNQECYDELMRLREKMLDHLYSLSKDARYVEMVSQVM